jgi:hypothetical protein
MDWIPRRWILAALAWMLLFFAAAVLIANVLVWLYPHAYENAISLGLAAALVAVSGVFLSAHWRFGEKQQELSEFYLEKSLVGWDRAWTLLDEALRGKPDDRRVRWIAAARIIERSRLLMERVSEGAHRDVLEIELTHQRQRFHEFFEQEGWFYYGVDAAAITVPAGSSTLDEAGKASTTRGGGRISMDRQIPEQVMYTIWRALQYPKDYWDVIDSDAAFEDGKIIFLEPGMCDYINHARQWRSVAGKLIPRRS